MTAPSLDTLLHKLLHCSLADAPQPVSPHWFQHSPGLAFGKHPCKLRFPTMLQNVPALVLIASTIDASAYSFWQMWVFGSYGTQERRQVSSRVRKLILNSLFREITRRAWIRQTASSGTCCNSIHCEFVRLDLGFEVKVCMLFWRT